MLGHCKVIYYWALIRGMDSSAAFCSGISHEFKGYKIFLKNFVGYIKNQMKLINSNLLCISTNLEVTRVRAHTYIYIYIICERHVPRSIWLVVIDIDF